VNDVQGTGQESFFVPLDVDLYKLYTVYSERVENMIQLVDLNLGALE